MDQKRMRREKFLLIFDLSTFNHKPFESDVAFAFAKCKCTFTDFYEATPLIVHYNYLFLNECLHVTFLSLCPSLSPLLNVFFLLSSE